MADDPVITDEEKDALLDGVETGEVEVQADGESTYASVRDYEFPPRCRIVSNSYPRLGILNQQIAIKASRNFEALLNTACVMQFKSVELTAFSALADQGRCAILEFKLAPYEGSALVYLNTKIMGNLVEAFFGGSGDNPPHEGPEGFTAGEMTVATVFAREFLSVLKEVWASLEDVEPEVTGVRQDTDVIEVLEPNDDVIVCEFEAELLGEPRDFQLVLPLKVVQPLVPAFEGRKRDRDVAEDVRWEQAIRGTVVHSNVSVSSLVGDAELTLRDIANLKPGDIIDIEDPRNGRLVAGEVAVLEGRFGVHDGCYAMETTRWLSQDVANQQHMHS